MCAVVGSAPLSVDTKKIDNKTLEKAHHSSLHTAALQTHTHTHKYARAHTQSCCRSFLLVFLVGCDFLRLFLDSARAWDCGVRERRVSLERLDSIGVKALRRKKKREKTARVRVGGRDVFRILRAVEERKSLNDDVFFDVVAFERASVRGGSRAKRGGVVAKKGSKRSGLRSGDWRRGGRLVIKSEVESHEERNRKTRTRSGRF